MVQEYGRYFGMPTCCLRGGCLTGPESQRRRAARLPQLPGEVQSRGPRVPGLRLQGQAGPRQHPQPRRRPLHPRIRRASPLRRGLQPRRRQGQFVLASSKRSRSSSAVSGKPQRYTYVETNRDRRPHLLLQRPSQDAAPLSAAGTSRSRSSSTIGQIVEAWQRQARFVKILITGACGFVGSTLIRAPGVERHGAARSRRPSTTSSARAASRIAARCDRARRRGPPRRHPLLRPTSSACRPSMPSSTPPRIRASSPASTACTSSRQLVEHNLVGTVNVLEYCRRHQAALVLLSTSRVYSIPPLAALPVAVAGRRASSRILRGPLPPG